DADYSSTLLKISQDVAAILKADFKLISIPSPGTVKVKINGAEVTTGFTVVGVVLRFTEAPPKAATIDVTYSVGAVPMTTNYALGEMPAPNSLKVQVNGSVV